MVCGLLLENLCPLFTHLILATLYLIGCIRLWVSAPIYVASFVVNLILTILCYPMAFLLFQRERALRKAFMVMLSRSSPTYHPQQPPASACPRPHVPNPQSNPQQAPYPFDAPHSPTSYALGPVPSAFESTTLSTGPINLPQRREAPPPYSPSTDNKPVLHP